MLSRQLLVILCCMFICFAPLPGNATDVQVLKVGIGDPIDSGSGAFGIKFKELVEKQSNGALKIELFPNCSLGDESEMIQNVRRGSLDMTVVGIGNVVPLVPGLSALTIPYLLSSDEDVVKATTGELFDYFNSMSMKSGLRILGYCYGNFRLITNSKRPVTSLADVAGLKLRVPNNKVFVETYRAWGANPVPMAWAETFTAMQQGVVDGQDNPYVVNYTMKFHEVQKFLTEIHYHYSLIPMLIGVRVFDALDKETQTILMDSAMKAQAYVLQWENEQSVKARDAMKEKGMVISVLTDEAQWKQIAMEKVWPSCYEFVGGKEVLDYIQSQLKK